MKTIRFKSTPENWIKEFRGIKPNTVRFMTDWDKERYEKCISATHIEIQNTKTYDSFKRKIMDITEYEDIIIISWRDENE